jgi:hypothetical protein
MNEAKAQQEIMDRIVGYRWFADGITRPVYVDDQGQYIIDEGERVYGSFVENPPDEETRNHEC